MALDLQDTPGCGYDRFRPVCYPDAHVILMCYSIDSKESLVNIEEKWAPEMRYFCPGVPVILVATKSDLRRDKQTIQALEKDPLSLVSSQTGRLVADKIKATDYMECSAKCKDGVKELFDCATRVALRSINFKNNRKTQPSQLWAQLTNWVSTKTHIRKPSKGRASNVKYDQVPGFLFNNC